MPGKSLPEILDVAVYSLHAIAVGPEKACCLQKLAHMALATLLGMVDELPNNKQTDTMLETVRRAMLDAEGWAAKFSEMPEEKKCQNCTFNNREHVWSQAQFAELYSWLEEAA